MSDSNILITGCSGGGKSSIIDALRALGFRTVAEPGRRIVAEELASGGAALPWSNPGLFAARAVRMARSDLAAVEGGAGPVFFDRGLVDAAVALAFHGGASYRAVLGPRRHYAERVFLAPPWPEIFASDAERRHGPDEAEAEYARLVAALRDLGYETLALPKAPVRDRVDFILSAVRAP